MKKILLILLIVIAVNVQSQSVKLLNSLSNNQATVTPSNPLASATIVRWKLNGNANDFVSTNNGTSTSVVWASGRVTQSAYFNGTSSFISIPDNDELSFTDGTDELPFSISLLIKFDLNLQSRFISKREIGGVLNEWQFIYNTDNGGSPDRLNLSLFNSTASTGKLLRQVPFTPILNQWYHLTATYDGSKTLAGIRIYIDGVLQTNTSHDVSGGTYLGMTNNSRPILIGKGDNNSNYHDGVMDEITIYNRRLLLSEILSLSTDQLSGIER